MEFTIYHNPTTATTTYTIRITDELIAELPSYLTQPNSNDIVTQLRYFVELAKYLQQAEVEMARNLEDEDVPFESPEPEYPDAEDGDLTDDEIDDEEEEYVDDITDDEDIEEDID